MGRVGARKLHFSDFTSLVPSSPRALGQDARQNVAVVGGVLLLTGVLIRGQFGWSMAAVGGLFLLASVG